MHIPTLVLTTLTTLAATSPLEPRAPYTWKVKKFLDERGSDRYDYSFTISGAKTHAVPGFVASCSGHTPRRYATCFLESHVGRKPEVKSHVKNVVDPNDENDTVPEVEVEVSWTSVGGCTYTLYGSHIAVENASGTGPASHFKIVPAEETSVC